MSVESILIVDDEEKLARILQRSLQGAGLDAEAVTDAPQALEALDRRPFDVVLTDLKMPGMDGIELLERVRRQSPSTDVVMMTAYASTETAIEAMKKGAYDYLIKPFPVDELMLLLNRLGETRGLRRENTMLREEVSGRVRLDNVIAASGAMQAVLTQVRKVARSAASVLLRGESGTGKEVLATAIHHLSPRASGPLVKVNCGAIPETLLEAELFGHVKGAFTGAIETREGHFRTADEGTIFLDEIAEMPPPLQVKLLRVLQEGEYTRVGESITRRVDVRVIAATNQDLEAMMTRGTFRQDLYYRLNVLPILIPPLRDRPEDIPALIEHFCSRFAPKGTPIRFAPDAYDLLLRYPWPGNIRELENAVEHATVMSESDEIGCDDLPLSIRQWGQGATAGEPSPGAAAYKPPAGTLESMEVKAIREALAKTGGNQTRAARLLGITRRTLGYRMKKHAIEPEKGEA
ncbi:sigma-54-dependent Fis family transcriptional regulator [Candidatus Sumerlaeota bacterium]|nr:sigma-54-dependent Fis family transcriptional regulator [Candidatus Sumerlaeota bacterium]